MEEFCSSQVTRDTPTFAKRLKFLDRAASKQALMALTSVAKVPWSFNLTMALSISIQQVSFAKTPMCFLLWRALDMPTISLWFKPPQCWRKTTKLSVLRCAGFAEVATSSAEVSCPFKGCNLSVTTRASTSSLPSLYRCTVSRQKLAPKRMLSPTAFFSRMARSTFSLARMPSTRMVCKWALGMWAKYCFMHLSACSSESRRPS